MNVWIELKSVFSCVVRFSTGPVHCSRDPQVFYSAKKNFKTESHGIIYTFKNYFATVFSVFSCIQMDPKYSIRRIDLIVSTNSQCNESIIALITIVKN